MVTLENGPLDEAYLTAKLAEYQKVARLPSQSSSYRVDRPFFARIGEPQPYLDFLPCVVDRKPEEIVSEICDGKVADVLDVGCGNGAALIQLVREYPNISAAGISSYPHHEDNSLYRHVLIDGEIKYQPPTVNVLNDLGVDYRLGDAHHLTDVFPDRRFDLVVSVFTAMHLFDPWRMAAQVNEILKEDGIALIGSFFFYAESGVKGYLSWYLEQVYKGNLEFDNTAGWSMLWFKKQSDWQIPLSLNRVVYEHHSNVPHVEYIIDKNSVQNI